MSRGRGHPSIIYDKAKEHIVYEAIDHVGLTYQRLHGGGKAEQIKAAEERLAQARDELAEVEGLRGQVSAASFALAHSDALAAIEQAETELASLDPTEGFSIPVYTTPGGTRQWFDRLSVPEQRRFLHTVIARATLLAGVKGSAAERLHIEFRHAHGPRGVIAGEFVNAGPEPAARR
jgi:hypothetical protein